MTFLNTKQLIAMGFGCRVTIWKMVKYGDFPAPMKCGSAVNAPNSRDKDEIDNWVKELKLKAIAKTEIHAEFRAKHKLGRR